MKIQNFRRFTPEDYPQYAGPEGERFLQHLNEVFEGLNTPLQGRLSLTDNFNTEVKTLLVEQNVPYNVSLKRLRGRCVDVQVWDPDLYDIVNIAWDHVSQNEIMIRVVFDSAPTTATEVTLLFMGE